MTLLFASMTPWILVLAIILDAVFGDPDRIWKRIPHPVVIIGAVISRFESWWNRTEFSGFKRKALGYLSCVLLVLLTAMAGLLIQKILPENPAGIIIEAILIAILIAFKSLSQHAIRVMEPLLLGDLPAARKAVSMIVGRDPEMLDENGVARATVETIAENYSDGVVAPIFWALLFGLPGILVYKAINTADSMIGHLSNRYRDFGEASARLDDVLNYIPARLSAFQLCCAAGLLGHSTNSIWKMVREDALKHPSPNAGWPEAAMAAALDLALAGPRQYTGYRVNALWMNEQGNQDAGGRDINKALTVMKLAALINWVMVIACIFVMGNL